ncbi:g9245 [Coccomyxa elongata]
MLQVRRQLPELLARVESSLTASTAQAWETVHKREKITVPVVNNQVDKAMKTLSRKLVAGQMLKEWKKRAYFVRPAEQRVLDQKETEKRLAKKRFKATMNAIMARRAQGY